MIDRSTGALLVDGARIERETTRTGFRASALGREAAETDLHTGWWHYFFRRKVGARDAGVMLHFEAERFDSYRVWDCDPRFGFSSWEDWSEKKLLDQRDAHDAWLVEMFGPGQRVLVHPGGMEMGGLELTYTFDWGTVASTYDPRSPDCFIGAHFHRR